MVLTRSKAAEEAKKNSTRRDLELAMKKKNRTCQNLVLLNDKMGHVLRRYNLAKAENHRVFRYKLRLKLAVCEGVRNAFYEYARIKQAEIAELRLELFNNRVPIVSNVDWEDSESDEEDSELDEDDVTVDV